MAFPKDTVPGILGKQKRCNRAVEVRLGTEVHIVNIEVIHTKDWQSRTLKSMRAKKGSGCLPSGGRGKRQ